MQLMLIVSGCKSRNVIADSPNVFAKTVNSYRHRIFEKLGVKSNVRLPLLAVWHNVVELDLRETASGEEFSALPGRKGPLAARFESDGAFAAALGIRDNDESA